MAVLFLEKVLAIHPSDLFLASFIINSGSLALH